jgi:uncharacterized membrane protein YhaH (DUF805 family)
MNVNYWYYAQGEQRFGPIDQTAMDAAIAAGTVLRDTPVWHIGMSDWATASQTALQAYFSSPPPFPSLPPRPLPPLPPPAPRVEPAIPTVPQSTSAAGTKSAANQPGYWRGIFSLNGRLGRAGLLARCCTFFCFGMLGSVVTRTSDGMLLFGAIFWMAMLVLALIAVMQRLHDLGKSGGWGLLLLLPLIGIWYGVYLVFAAGDKDENKYGPPPAHG